MSESTSETCASCDEAIEGRPRHFRLPTEWRMYLEDERDLGWFPLAPVVVTCFECYHDLKELKNSHSELRAYGTDSDVDEIEGEVFDVLDDLTLDRIVDEGEI
ncbi:hypothetical protein [Halorubrum sodomense]|uniref:Uncharacterized protein n=1 Tax=Halorubrum sodomense TaxID=35743 RepID=A0A1I6HKT7_HALSD|nr:hypothetical protein [Halorubrum sodomense]SFR55056.1 hypothetical protein SAMN04487937_2715 [Halorubrum sodomense]